ncbi:hypothetical protein PFLUV_G00170960 [Perca fluviatilis]|uniref:Uncharacterized protein n=1 Tax=Perca fluviatilis TaxID=8168 RepID=A0A6A5EF70_PERFL|nr:hypothetical protein PFLUV_G00170960 [Perca fluviatilis]
MKHQLISSSDNSEQSFCCSLIFVRVNPTVRLPPLKTINTSQWTPRRALTRSYHGHVGFLFYNRTSFTHAAKLTLVNMTILPILDFSDVVYRTASNSLLKTLDVIYHSAIRFALVGWPSLHTRRLTHWYQLIYMSMLGKALLYLHSLVTIGLTPPAACALAATAHTSFGTYLTHSFQFSAANDWNAL